MSAPLDPATEARARLSDRALAMRQTAEVHAEWARRDPAFFMGYVMRDSAGRRLALSPTHKAWHDLATKHKNLVILAHVESGKTTALSISRVLWEMGNDPSIHACILSNTHKQATKLVGAIAGLIEQSPEVQRVFPTLRKGRRWTHDALTVERPGWGDKDPTLQAAGVHGAILGARLDLVIIDDILDWENCRTRSQREALREWILATLHGRLTERAKVVVVGTAYHPEDLLHWYARQPGFAAFKYPVVHPETGAPRWPERWSAARIAAKRLELGPLEFARQMLCEPSSDEHARFKREWVARCLALGDGKEFAYGLKAVPPGYRTITGVDLAVQQHSAADLTVMSTIIVHPDGTREVLCIESGRWAGPEIVQRIIETHERYQSIVIVENNAAQQYIVQFTGGRSAVPVRGFTTGRNKANPEFGVESIAAEMAAGKWILPSVNGMPANKEVAALVDGMYFYDPSAHTSDHLMSLWFAREGVRLGEIKAEYGQVDWASR